MKGIITLRPQGEEYDYDEFCHDVFRVSNYLLLPYTGYESMTPQEELFAGFFSSEKILVKDMSILELRAHREELSKIAFEARARLTAIDDEERERVARKKKENGPTGFTRSVNTDETTTNAINAIDARAKKLKKSEAIAAGLAKLFGGDEAQAQKVMSAGTILGRIKTQAAEATKKEEEKKAAFVNPFTKKE